jgi:hypothetical protein
MTDIDPEISSRYVKIAENLLAQLEQSDSQSAPQIVFE